MTDPGPATAAGWALLDAEAEHDATPEGFSIPSAPERAGLEPGDQVKLVFDLEVAPTEGPNAELLWLEVLARTEDGYEGKLTSQPTVVTDLTEGDVVGFRSCHVAGIALASNEISFSVDLQALITQRALAQTAPPGWVAHDDPVDEIDSGWTLYVGDEGSDAFDGDPADITQAVTLGELAQRYPGLVEVFQAGSGEWVYRTDHRRYVRAKPLADTTEPAPDPVLPDHATEAIGLGEATSSTTGVEPDPEPETECDAEPATAQGTGTDSENQEAPG